MIALKKEPAKIFVNPLIYMPVVSIILPFNPKMVAKSEINQSLIRASRQAEAELSNCFNKYLSSIVLSRLASVVRRLNYSTDKRSLAIYLSPIFEKVIYMDIEVEIKVSVDTRYRIRELVNSKIICDKYLVITLSKSVCNIYLGGTNGLKKIVCMAPEPEDPEHAILIKSNIQKGIESCKDIQLSLFLKRVDDALGLILLSSLYIYRE